MNHRHTSNDDVITPFPSFAVLSAEHSKLLERHHTLGDDDYDLLIEVQDFIRRGQATGILLDNVRDRWTCQSQLDYWITILDRAGFDVPESTLAEFDSALAPVLDPDNPPYLGLKIFESGHHHFFFGRQRLIDILLSQLEGNHLLAVVGPPGSGKSSLVLGGLVPSLQANALMGSRDWRYDILMAPGSNPLTSLTQLWQPEGVDPVNWVPQQVELLQQDSGHLLRMLKTASDAPSVLVIDRFEDIFTLCANDDIREAFINNLLALIDDRYVRRIVLIVMRSDVETHVMQLPRLGPLFEQARIHVNPLDASELREAIEKPADLVGLKFDDGVVEALIYDILGEESGPLLLQVTLWKLWEGRIRNRITDETYRRVGGGRLALVRSASALFKSFPPQQQVTAQRVLSRLAQLSMGLAGKSHRIRRAALDETSTMPAQVDEILHKFVRAQLMCLTQGGTPEDTQVEAAHEALLLYWSSLTDKTSLDLANSPYPGLNAFQSDQHYLFFGRQQLIRFLVGRLKESQLLAVVGPSGSGKSSLVLGGLLSVLPTGALPGSQEWHYYPPMVPGSDPLTNLARAIQPHNGGNGEWIRQQAEAFRQTPGRLVQLLSAINDRPAVLVIDQFEEIFTLCTNDRVRSAFINNILSLLQVQDIRHIVILTMRSDFESYVARLPELQSRFGEAQARVMPLVADELDDAIERPAELVGLDFENGVTAKLLRDILGEPAGLPLLQFTLLKLWENREGNRVTLVATNFTNY